MLPATQRTLAAALIAAVLFGCGGGGGSSPSSAGPVTLSLNASQNLTTANGKAITLNATASGNAAVSWQLAGGSPGALSAPSGSSVQYRPPPGGVDTAATVMVTATAGSTAQTITLTVHPDPGPARLERLAGGNAGSIDGSGTAASFAGIRALAADSSGNLIAAEPEGLRKITPAGVVSTFKANSAIKPDSVAAGPAGSVYFTESDNSSAVIRRLNADGSVVSLAAVTLTYPDRLRLYSSGGAVYAFQNERISMLDAAGTLTPFAGQISGAARPDPVDGPLGQARFRAINSIARASNGDLYVMDAVLVRKISAGGTVSTVAGTLPTGNSTGFMTPQDGTGSAAHFVSAGSLAIDGQGKLAVLEFVGTGDRPTLLRTITPGGVVSSVPLPYNAAGQLVASSSGTLYAVNPDQVNVLQPDGTVKLLAGSFRANPFLFTVDAAGNAYVADFRTQGNHLPAPVGLLLLKISGTDAASTLAQSTDVRVPTGVVADRSGNIYVSEIASSGFAVSGAPGGAIFKVTQQGTVSLFAGTTGVAGAPADGSGTGARFVQPMLVGSDADGNIYANDPVAVGGAIKVRKISPAGVVSTIDALPAGVGAALDALGNRYTADTARGVILRTAPDGGSSIVAGTENRQENIFGSLPGALSSPSRLIATGPFSFLVVANGSVVRLVVPH